MIGIAVVDDSELHYARALSREQLYAAEKILERTIDAVTARLRTQATGTRTVAVLRVNELLAELHSLVNDIHAEYLLRETELIGGVADALHRLRGIDSTAQMIERATVEVCRGCGVDRCALLRSDGSQLFLESVHFAAEPAWQEEFEAFARAHPATLAPNDPEVQLLRRRIPVLVNDPVASAGMRELTVDAGHSTSYVAVPVIARGGVVGTLHADRHFSGAPLDPVVLSVVAAFAAGFGYALERTVLQDRSRAQVRRMREMLAETETSMEQIFGAGVSLRRDQRGSISTEDRGPAWSLTTESRLSGLLTRRELEVMDLMARGASNADIAADLVISEGTVKSHVKHILRKMHAANRAQAVSTYVRVQARSQGGARPWGD
jgi:DNA-binding CsgD family transcriptional regulator